MAEVTEQSVVSNDNYAEVKRMMLANDEGSKNLALAIMEQSDFEKSQIYILCLLKETFPEVYGKNGPYTEFEEKYPQLHKNVSDLLNTKDTNISQLSFKSVYEVACKRKDRQEMEFMLSIFTDELLGLLKTYGFTFIEYLDIQIKPKGIDLDEFK